MTVGTFLVIALFWLAVFAAAVAIFMPDRIVGAVKIKRRDPADWTLENPPVPGTPESLGDPAP